MFCHSTVVVVVWYETKVVLAQASFFEPRARSHAELWQHFWAMSPHPIRQLLTCYY